MGSKRLPGKILMDLAGAPLLQRLLERVKRSKLIDRIVVATSDRSENAPVETLCRDLGYSCWRGSENDVLVRVIDAAADADIVIRLTADNPFVDGALVDLVLQKFLDAWPGIHYAANVTDSGFPYGLFVEVADMNALKMAADSDDPMDREHVTWHIRQRPSEFKIQTVLSPVKYPDEGLTFDSIDDYKRLKPVFEDMYRKNPNFSFIDIAKYENRKLIS
jgi:spore coat polysaccharide biosynthesis protein SpsF